MSEHHSPEERTKFETYFRQYNGWTFARDEDGDYTEIAIELAFEAWTEQSRRIAALERDLFSSEARRKAFEESAQPSPPPITDADDIMNLQIHELETIDDELPSQPPTPAYYCKNCRCANCGNTFAKNVAETAAPPNDRYELALRWLAESCDPKKLTGEFAVDHARRALEGSRIEPAAPPISTQCATHAIEYRIIKGIPCPWCVIDELKRNRDKAVTPPSDVDGLNSPSYLREMANEMARRVDDVGKKAIMSYMALYNLRNAGIDVQVPESQLIDETRTRITVTGRIKDLRLFNQRMKEADLAIAYNEFKQPSPETRDCQCATYCMQALGMRSTPPQRCRGLPQLETNNG